MGIPVTEHVRPIAAILEQARQACERRKVKAAISDGTTADTLLEQCATLLTQSGGGPCAVIAYGGSDFANKPRRTSEIDIFVFAVHTPVRPAFGLVEDAAWGITEELDDLVTQEVSGGYPITDRWKLRSEQAMDLGAIKAAAAILLQFDLEDY